MKKSIKSSGVFTFLLLSITFFACSKDNSSEPTDGSNFFASQLIGNWMECKEILLYSENGGQDRETDFNAASYTYLRIELVGENVSDGIVFNYLDNRKNLVTSAVCQIEGNKIVSNGSIIGSIESCSVKNNWDDLIILWEKGVVFGNKSAQCRVMSYYMHRH